MKILSGTPRPANCLSKFIRAITPIGLSLLLGTTPAFGSRIVNLSTRADVGNGNNVVIAGFILTGSGAATLVFRGIGPSLAPYFPSGTVLADPNLDLYNQNGAIIWSNNNWQDSQAADIAATGLAPGNPNESAIKWSLGPGLYSVVLSGV